MRLISAISGLTSLDFQRNREAEDNGSSFLFSENRFVQARSTEMKETYATTSIARARSKFIAVVINE